MHPAMVVEQRNGAIGEQALVERARRGDVHAYDALVASRLGSTFRLVKAIVGHDADADDVTQEAFVQAWRTLPQLRDADRFDAWFGRVIVNTARMHLRRRRHVLTVSVTELDAHDHPALGRVDAALEGVATSQALQSAIDRLTVDQRTILALHHVEERPLKDIAAMLEIPVGTAKWRLSEARNALRRVMESQA
jgi:RNA polymerase sigma-70 factor (ECF subfamily)